MKILIFKENLKNIEILVMLKVNLTTAIDIYISNILPYLEQKEIEYENIYIDKPSKSDLSESFEFKLVKISIISAIKNFYWMILIL